MTWIVQFPFKGQPTKLEKLPEGKYAPVAIELLKGVPDRTVGPPTNDVAQVIEKQYSNPEPKPSAFAIGFPK